MEYPKRLVVDPVINKYADILQAYFDTQFLDECDRLGLDPIEQDKLSTQQIEDSFYP